VAGSTPFKWRHFTIGHHPAVCTLVSALPAQLPQSRRDDAGAGAYGRPYDDMNPVGELIRKKL